MATKKSNSKAKSRTSSKKSNQLTQYKFHWWMALIGVLVVAVIGIVIVRYSHAYGKNDCSYGYCVSGVVRGNNGYGGITIEQYSSGRSTGVYYYQLTGRIDAGFYDASAGGNCYGIQPGGFKPNASFTNGSTVNVVKGCG